MATAETILNSETKIQILRTLSVSDRSYSAEDLEKETTKDITSIYKALEDLRKENMLKIVQTDGKQKYYKLDTAESGVIVMGGPIDFPKSVFSFFYSEVGQYGLRDLPPHALNIIFNFRKRLINQIDGLKNIILFGSATKGNYSLGSDIDLYIVVEENPVEVEDQIYEISRQYDHEFSLIIKSENQYISDFSKPLSKLADSMLKEGHKVLYGEAEELKKHIKQGEY